MCRPPGATSTTPCCSASPSCASRTGSALRWSRRSASERVNPAGMCCTTRIVLASARGRRGMMACSADGPPVDVPITITSAWRSGRAGAAAGLSGPPAPASRSRGTLARARTLASSSSARPSRFMWPWTLDLSTKSMAPSSSPRRVTSAPSLVCDESSSTGVGHSAMIRRSASSPPMRGIFTSSVTTSGRRSSTFSTPSSPSTAVATTSTSGAAPSIRESACRTKAESSTTRTRITGPPRRREGISGTPSPPGSGPE